MIERAHDRVLGMEESDRRPRCGKEGQDLDPPYRDARTSDGGSHDEHDRERPDEGLGRPEHEEHPRMRVGEEDVAEQVEAVADGDDRCEEDRKPRRVRVSGAAGRRFVEMEDIAVRDRPRGAQRGPRIGRYHPHVHALDPGNEHDADQEDEPGADEPEDERSFGRGLHPILSAHARSA